MSEWASAKLEELTTKVGSGATPQGGAEAYCEIGIPLIRSMNVHFDGFHPKGLTYLNDQQARKLDNVRVEAGDVLLNITGASIGRVCQAPADMQGARVNQHVAIIRPGTGVDARWIRYLLSSPDFQGKITAENYGVTRQALTKEMILGFDIPVPPSNEQRRIVEKVEALLIRSRRAKKVLDALPALLDRYRQSVLAAAFRGDLTAGWRARNGVGPGADRIRQLIADQSAARAAEETRQRRTNTLPLAENRPTIALDGCPSSWATMTLEEVTDPLRLIQYGILMPGPDTPGGVPYVKVMNIKGDRIAIAELRRTTHKIHGEYTRSQLEAGDVLLTIRGTFGRVAIVPDALDGGNITQDTARIAPLPALASEYVAHYLRSPLAQRYFAKVAKGVAVRGVNIGDIRPMPIPVPPYDEQIEISRELARALDTIERLRKHIEAKVKKFDTLTQSILAKAFRGELVPQDPNDEPASVLLDRIRAERAAAGADKPRRGRRKAAPC